LSGYDDTGFSWCASGNPENWTTGNSGDANVQKTGEKIRNMIANREKVYFFKDNSTEVWINVGGDAPFVRQDGLWINKGCGADYSVVKANDTIYWFGNDGDFYVLNGGRPEVISKTYRSVIDDLTKTDNIYGFDFRKENMVRWYAPTNGKCFVYDYAKNIFSEDNRWDGKWGRMPINSYMELNGEQYFGDYEPTGKVYHWSDDYKDDDGQNIRVNRKFAINPSEKGNRVKFSRLGFRVKRGQGDIVSNPKLSFRTRIDRKKWSKIRHLDLGNVGEHNPWIYIHRIGIGREIEIEVTETDAVDYLLTHMNMTVAELGR
jgi:hypothetical protein